MNIQGLQISRRLERFVILSVEQTWNFFITKHSLNTKCFMQTRKIVIIQQALDERTNLMDSVVITVNQDGLG